MEIVEYEQESTMSMISAGLSLLESLNGSSPVPPTPNLNVLLSHPTMTTKGGAHSPPPRRRQFKGKPTFEQTLKDEEVEIGDRAKFSAVVKGDPQPLVTWFTDGFPIRSGATYRYIKDGDRHNLMIPRVQANTGCTITCKAVNQHGEASSSAKLIISKKGDANVVDDDDMRAGSDVSMGEYSEKMQVSLSNADSEESMETTDVTLATFASSIEEKRTEMSTVDFESSAVSLLSSSALVRDTAYSFQKDSTVEKYFPNLDQTGYTVDELSPSKRSPKFVHFHEDTLLQEYTIGDTDSSEVCSEASSNVSFKHVMVHEGADWTEEVRRLIREEIDKREEDRKTSDEAQINDVTKIESDSETPPPKFTKPICDCAVTAGETAHFVYVLKSTSPTIVTWLRNGTEVERSSDNPNLGIIDDDDAGCLLISDAKQKHSGVYTCIAENISGSAKCTAKLIVTPNFARMSRSTSTRGEEFLEVKKKLEFRDQTSQTVVATENKAVNAESATESLREINDDETGEGGRGKMPRD